MSGTYEYECHECAGEGRYEVVDGARITRASIEPPLKWVDCPRCGATGSIQVDEQAHGLVCVIQEEHRRERIGDRFIIEVQRQQIATLEALLKAERDRAAQERRAS